MAEDNGDKGTPNEIPAGMKQALDTGWAPEDQWKGNPDEWVDWKEYNFRGQLMDRIQEQSGIISRQKNKIEEFDTTLKEVKEFQKTISEREYKRAMQTLRAEKAKALEDEDHTRFVEIEDEIDNLKEQRKATVDSTPSQPGETKLPEEVVEWVENPKNKWYTADNTLHNYANSIMADLKSRNPTLPPSTLLRMMEEQVKADLPNKFKPENGSAVDDGGDNFNNSGRGRKTPTFADLDDEQKAVATRFEKLGYMTKDEYVKEMIEAGEL